MAIVLDAGGLIAIERGGTRVLALLQMAELCSIPLVTSAAVVARVWRHGSRQANLARTLRGVRIVPLDAVAGRRVGELLAGSGTADVVDAHLASLVGPGDTVLTSDEPDIRRLLTARGLPGAHIEVV